ncbi:hypothetical protein ACMD2_11156, partial [Ananas comosus]
MSLEPWNSVILSFVNTLLARPPLSSERLIPSLGSIRYGRRLLISLVVKQACKESTKLVKQELRKAYPWITILEPRCSIFEDQVEHKRSYGFNDQKDDPTTTFSGFGDPGSPCATSSISGKSEIRDSIGKAPEIVSQATSAPRS